MSAGNAARVQPQLILCILPFESKDFYAEIKRVSDTVIGVASQCIQFEYLKNPRKQYCANVCLKINVKLGGLNSFLNPTNIEFIVEEPTIVMGADVTHPKQGKFWFVHFFIYLYLCILILCVLIVYHVLFKFRKLESLNCCSLCLYGC